MPCETVHGCVPLVWWCDGLQDCSDGSDESSCHLPETTEQTTEEEDEDEEEGEESCGENDFTCITSGECIPYIQVCNGEEDCQDLSDEASCKSR